jgi:acetylglutamate kinase
LTDVAEEAGWATAKTLAEALPYIQIYDRETVVIKYGGHAMGQEQVAKLFAADAVLLKLLGVHPVVVHGGGPQISRMLDKAGVIQALLTSETDYIPVIAPIGVSTEGQTFNINADTVAGALAGALKAKRMLMLTDIAGVLDGNGQLIRQMTIEEARGLIQSGVASGGMIPKLENAIHAVENGVEAVVILDGRRPHAMLVELFSEHGAGTLISK